jgi:hypothetical protein
LTFARTSELPKVDFVRMRDGEDYAMAPVMAGLCRYESLFDGSLTLVDLARLNEALSVKAANEARAFAAAKAKKD